MEFCKGKNNSSNNEEEGDKSATAAKTSAEEKDPEEFQSLFGISGKLWLTVFRCLVIIGCFVAVVVQSTECYQKLIKPPILTQTRFLVNDSLFYPALTICREPPFRAEVFLKYGLGASPRYTSEWRNFPWGEVTMEQLYSEATYPADEVFVLYGLKNVPSNVELSSSFFFESGACHTLKPKTTTEQAGFAVGYSIIVTHSGETDNTVGEFTSPEWHVYVHETSETWTENKMQSLGRQEALFVEAGEEVHIKLTVEEFRQTNVGHDRNCAVEVANGGEVRCFERCRWEQIANYNCAAPWLPGIDLPECDNYNKTRNLIIEYLKHDACIPNCCDCKSSCRVVRYEALPITRRPFVNSMSQIYVFFNSRLVTLMEERPAYDWSNFFTDMGATLGFLLGLSVMESINVFEKGVDFITSTKSKKNPCET